MVYSLQFPPLRYRQVVIKKNSANSNTIEYELYNNERTEKHLIYAYLQKNVIINRG